jgi:hypothetical protein
MRTIEPRATASRTRATRLATALTALAAGFGCASSGTSGGDGEDGGASGNVVTRAEMLESSETDVYAALQRLRPRWLRARGQASFSGSTVVMLFVDGSPRGDVTNLRGLPINDIRDITYLSASEAAFQFGTMAGNGGALAVRTAR